MAHRRILMISALEVWALAGGGGAPSLYETLRGYTRRGYEIDFVTSTIGANHHHGAPVQPPPDIEGVTFHRFHLPSLAELPLPLPRIVLRADQKLRFAAIFPILAGHIAFNRLVRSLQYDAIYGYEVHGVLAARLVRLRMRERLPFVARFQGTIMHPYLDDRAQLARRYEEVLALRAGADLFVMTDDGTQGDEVLARLNPRSNGRVRFWRNGLALGPIRAPSTDEERSARESAGLAADDFVLVTAARLARWKRIDRAIDAVALLRDRGVSARLIIVGDGEERTNLEAQARSLRVDGLVSFAGAVPQSEVARYLWAADVFLSLNELSNVGNPLLEAMVAGRCVLTLDEGDTRDVIANDQTGVLLHDASPAAIADALASLHGQPERRARLGDAARRFADASFWSWQERLDAEVDAVDALLAGPVAKVHV